MPDDNRFAGLSEAVEDDPGAEADDESASDAGSDDCEDAGSTAPATAATAREPDAASETDADEGTAAGETDSDASADSSETDSTEDDPTAFPFDATEKKTVYVRPDTIADLDDTRALVDAQLRTEHDVRDLTGREFYDAVFRLAASDTEGLIDEILAAREE